MDTHSPHIAALPHSVLEDDKFHSTRPHLKIKDDLNVIYMATKVTVKGLMAYFAFHLPFAAFHLF